MKTSLSQKQFDILEENLKAAKYYNKELDNICKLTERLLEDKEGFAVDLVYGNDYNFNLNTFCKRNKIKVDKK